MGVTDPLALRIREGLARLLGASLGEGWSVWLDRPEAEQVAAGGQGVSVGPVSLLLEPAQFAPGGLRYEAQWSVDVWLWAGMTVSPEDCDRLLWSAADTLIAALDNTGLEGVPELQDRAVTSVETEDTWGERPLPRLLLSVSVTTRM